MRLSLTLHGAPVLLCWEAAATGKEEGVLTRRPARRQRGRRTHVRTDQDPHGQCAEDLRVGDAHRGKINNKCRDWKGRETTGHMTAYLKNL